MPNNIERETYVGMPIKDKLNVLYDMSMSIDKRTVKLEKRKRFDTTIAGFTGLAGGALAVITSKLVFWK